MIKRAQTGINIAGMFGVSARAEVLTVPVAGASQTRADVDAQRVASFACAKDIAFTSSVSISNEWADGVTTLPLLSTETVSPSLAYAINGCASDRMEGAAPTHVAAPHPDPVRISAARDSIAAQANTISRWGAFCAEGVALA